METTTTTADPNLVPVPKAQLDELYSYKSRAAEAEAQAAAARAREMVSSGQSETLLREQSARVAAATARAGQFAVSTELSRALAAQPIIPASVGQLEALLKDDLVADATGDTFTVRTKSDYRSVSDFVAAKLATPEFAHFRNDHQPTTPVNRPTPGAPGNPTQPGMPIQPNNLGDAIVFDHQARSAAREAAGSTDPRTDLSKPFGLAGTAAGTRGPGPLNMFGR